MRDFEDSTLWRVSEFERIRQETGSSGYIPLAGATILPTTLLADLRNLQRDSGGGELLESIAACMRHHEAALFYLQHEELVWPVTLFPSQMIYHSPRDMVQATPATLADLKLISVEPPGVRPPGHWLFDRVAQAEHYRPLAPLLWAVAIHGPRGVLLNEIGGTAAYRAIKNLSDEGLVAPGAIGSAAERLRRESVSLRQMSTWPGLSVERASRLLNGLYLASALLVTRTHPAARAEPGFMRGLFGAGRRPRR